MLPEANYPPFPENLPTHPLHIIDYELLKLHDKEEIDRLWDAATTVGFWYLKNHGANEEVKQMFEMGENIMTLPTEEKAAFIGLSTDAVPFYKPSGYLIVDKNTGRKDISEFIHVSKDDALSWPSRIHRVYPDAVGSQMENTIIPFIKKSLQVNNMILEIFDDKLGLPPGTLLEKHSDAEWSPSEARVIRSAAHSVKGGSEIALGSHTDFGSLTFLHNILGGLQVLSPGSENWQYVKPIPGHAICNIGDTLSIFSGGILPSTWHRVTPPPGDQVKYDRYSLAYFTRPGNNVILQPLVKTKGSDAYNIGASGFDWYISRMKQYKEGNVKPID